MESITSFGDSINTVPEQLNQRSRFRPRLDISTSLNLKFDNVAEVLSPTGSTNGGTLTPDVAKSPPLFIEESPDREVLPVGDYILEQPIEVQDCPVKVFKAFHPATETDYICKVIELPDYQNTFKAYMRAGWHDNINYLHEVVQTPSRAYFFFEPHYGDLHMYVRHKKRLREAEAAKLFAQMVSAIGHCHDNGIALRDIKLRRFVFKNRERTELKLFGLEEAHVYDDDDDRHAGLQVCPAYMSPEVLVSCASPAYSTQKADVWVLGVMLYTMLIGRYPFSDRETMEIFAKIRKMDFVIPDTISSRAKCLIRQLMRFSPDERLSANQILTHPWYNNRSRIHHSYSLKTEAKQCDQIVPKWTEKSSDSDFFA